MAVRIVGGRKMVTYRTRLCLPEHHWRILQLQSAAHYIDGRMVIEDILKSWCEEHVYLLETDEAPAEAPTEAEGEDEIE